MSVILTRGSLATGSEQMGFLSNNDSTPWHMEGSAEPPKCALSLNPLKAGGLWLAVIITPPTARCAFTAKETAGVGVGWAVSTTLNPLPQKTSAARRANWSERKRRS